MDMWCFQCEQAAKGTGCTTVGVCGKDAETAAMQDLLVYAVKDISRYAHRAAERGARDRDVDVFVIRALFSTLTNVNFDPQRFQAYMRTAADMKGRAKDLYGSAADSPEELEPPVSWWEDLDDIDAMAQTGRQIGIDKRMASLGNTVAGVQELITYGLKGAAAYADHAQILGKDDEGLYASFHAMLDYLTRKPADADELLAQALKTGEITLKAMELLDAANTETYGHPEPTQVRVTPVKGKCIVVSGHDLKDLDALLKQTEGKGINVYTHGEMLPCLAYPELKKYPHLAGHYGGAWQDQKREFS
jgi:hydroxylamine reductase